MKMVADTGLKSFLIKNYPGSVKKLKEKKGGGLARVLFSPQPSRQLIFFSKLYIWWGEEIGVKRNKKHPAKYSLVKLWKAF